MTEDDPHDGVLPYTDDQERAAAAAAKARQAVARDPESALSDPESRDWRGWLVLGASSVMASSSQVAGAGAMVIPACLASSCRARIRQRLGSCGRSSAAVASATRRTGRCP